MALSYQAEPIVEGDWYISELSRIRRRTPGDKIGEPYPGVRNCRLAGGFSTEEEARIAEQSLKEKHPEYSGKTYVWRNSDSTENGDQN